MNSTNTTASISAPTDLRTEYQINPLGIDIPNPRFHWINESSLRGDNQTAYQILVSTSKHNLEISLGDFWDSGIIKSDQSIQVVYSGLPLTSNTTYFWKIRTWNIQGETSPFSEVSSFETGLFNSEDWTAHWVEASCGTLLRKEFTVPEKALRARVYVTACGLYELRLNGRKVSDYVLEPSWTDYHDRVLYRTHDITDHIQTGNNVIGAIVGLGPYRYMGTNPLEYTEGENPKIIVQLEVVLNNGGKINVTTDDSWKATSGPTISDDLYAGENYDARQESQGWDTIGFNDSEWDRVKVRKDFTTRLVAASEPPIRVIQSLPPAAIVEPQPGVFIVDMGNNYSGWIKLSVNGKKDTEITILYAEILDEHGRATTTNLIGSNTNPEQTDRYTLKGSEIETWEPTFTYKGFRYVEITGYPGTLLPENIVCQVVHTDVKSIGDFSSSNALINAIQQAFVRTQLNNLHGVPEDCPTREKRGWGADAHVAAEMALFNFDMAAFYTKWIGDLQTSQRADGGICCVSPGKDMWVDPAWGSAFMLVPWYMYQFHSDIRLLEDNYESMSRWIAYLQSKSTNHILAKPEYTWGNDWLSLQETPSELFRTGFYYWSVKVMTDIAVLLNRHEDALIYSNLANEIKLSFHDRLFDPIAGHYGNGSQYSCAFPLYLDLVPQQYSETVLNKLIEDIRSRGDHISGGILGTKYIIDTLEKYGRSDVIYDIVTNTEFNSWGYMLKNGPGTIWEKWNNSSEPDGTSSKNHPALCSIGSWFYRSLAGISQENSSGFKKITVRPKAVGDITHVLCSMETPYGKVRSEWKRTGREFKLHLTIPMNASAKVYLPTLGFRNALLQEGNTVLWDDGPCDHFTSGIASPCYEDSHLVFDVGSGRYEFILTEQ